MTDGSRDDTPERADPIPALRDPDRLRSLAETRLTAAPDEAFDRFARLVGDLLDVPVALVSWSTPNVSSSPARWAWPGRGPPGGRPR